MSSFNQSLFEYISRWAGKNPLIDGVGIFFASDVIYLLIAAFILLVLIQDGARRKIYLLCEGALAVLLSRGLITETIYFFYNHARPFLFYGFAPLIGESGPSFPSGHMTLLFALSMIVFYVNRKWGLSFFLVSLAVGIARIYVGVHWPLDIIGGIVIGILSAMLVHAALRKARNDIRMQDDTSPL